MRSTYSLWMTETQKIEMIPLQDAFTDLTFPNLFSPQPDITYGSARRQGSILSKNLIPTGLESSLSSWWGSNSAVFTAPATTVNSSPLWSRSICFCSSSNVLCDPPIHIHSKHVPIFSFFSSPPSYPHLMATPAAIIRWPGGSPLCYYRHLLVLYTQDCSPRCLFV